MTKASQRAEHFIDNGLRGVSGEFAKSLLRNGLEVEAAAGTEAGT
jgi:hypothetical protein